MISRKRDGTPVETYDNEGALIEKLYKTTWGKVVLRVLISPCISRLAGAFLSTKLSALLVKAFVKKNGISLNDYPDRKYCSFNDFFTRKILPMARPITDDDNRLMSPSDGKVTIFPLQENTHFTIKGVEYSMDTLLRNKGLGEKYKGGYGILIRLTVDDYHRYCYPVSGKKSKNVHLQGVYHTVNPRAAESCPIYRENTREYTLIKTPQFGTVLMMEIGAMLVGRIKNLHQEKQVNRGEEKGYFEFGGSSIMIFLQKNHFTPDADLTTNTQAGEETIVKQGESLGFLK